MDRPILKFSNPVSSERIKGSSTFFPRPSGPGFSSQEKKFESTFDRISNALKTSDPSVTLRQDPNGIAPDRALVFITAGGVANFVKVAQEIGLDVYVDTELDDISEYPEGFTPAGDNQTLPCHLYATMPTIEVFQTILSFWNKFKRGQRPARGETPWWSAFSLLLDLRPWGPDDRLSEDSRKVILDRLPLDDSDYINIEIEIWPSRDSSKIEKWVRNVEEKISELEGEVLDRSSINQPGFVYEAMLVRMPVYSVRTMLEEPGGGHSIATIEGVQFILPQTIAQALPSNIEEETDQEEDTQWDEFNTNSPFRAILLDGTPVAAHQALDGGVIMEDIHDIVPRSIVSQRYHATAMASLILRGDLQGDGVALKDTRLISVPILIDNTGGSSSPNDRLFVDLVHITLTNLILGEEPIAPDAFVVNFSIGISDCRFAGRISALARLLDWWAEKEGLLFMISAGNIYDPIYIQNMSITAFEAENDSDRRKIVHAALKQSQYERTLLAPAEAVNGVAVGAVSLDIVENTPIPSSGIFTIDSNYPQITSALGLGLNRMIKPDLVNVGGCVEFRAHPNGSNIRINHVRSANRTGLIVASPNGGNSATKKSQGTSDATALTTRSILRCAEALTTEGGPYEGLELPRRTIALLTRALAINSAEWPEIANEIYEEEKSRIGSSKYLQAKGEVCKQFGYGVLAPARMQMSPESGVTMVGYGTIKKDQAKIFKMPLPDSMSGDRVSRSMIVTIAWFSPVNSSRAQYKLANLEAVAADGIDDTANKTWCLDLKSYGIDANIIKKGSVWSRRLIHERKSVPNFDQDSQVPICVQCSDASGGGLSPDDDIEFAMVVTLEVEAEVQYDIHQEIEQKLRVQAASR